MSATYTCSIGQGRDILSSYRVLAGSEVAPAAQEVASGTPLGRIDVGHWEVASMHEARDLVAVLAVLLRLSAMNRPHVKGMTASGGL